MPFDQENTGPTRQAVFAVPAGAVVATCVLLFFAPATSAQEPSPSAQWQSVLEHIETVTPDRISPLQTEALQSVEDMSVRVDEAPTKLQPLLRTILIKNIPDEYEDLKRWGKTKRVFSGIHVQLDGGKLRTHRNRKDVNHGTWKKYQLQLVDPEEHLRVQVSNVRQADDGATLFDVALAARLNLYAQLVEYQLGVRLFSICAEATADVRLLMQCRLTTGVDLDSFPPGLILQPSVTSAEVLLDSFKLHRISDAHGPLVRHLSGELEDVVREKLAEKNEKLVEKINRQIDKNRDDLKLSVQDLVMDVVRKTQKSK